MVEEGTFGPRTEKLEVIDEGQYGHCWRLPLLLHGERNKLIFLSAWPVVEEKDPKLFLLHESETLLFTEH